MLHFSVSRGVIQRKKESWSSATSSTNDIYRLGPMALAVWNRIESILLAMEVELGD